MMVQEGIFMLSHLYWLSNATIRYQDEILRHTVSPYVSTMGPGFLLVCDNARPHVARVCRQSLEDEGIDIIDWSQHSPF